MGWFVLAKLFPVLISLIHLGCLSGPYLSLGSDKGMNDFYVS